MNFVNRVWRVGAFGLVVGLLAAACADDNGAAVGGPPAQVVGSISGTVTAEGTGAPIVGALVGTTPATSTALTDASGNYSIANIPIPESGSASFAVTVVTAVVFSAMETFAVAPPPLDVIAGASFASVMVTLSACESVPPLPSETCTVTW